jgi:hypothetical protein
VIMLIVALFLALSAYADTTILSQGARNVKTGLVNGVPYGGATAFGDGVHDDTQAFLDALNMGRNMATPSKNKANASPVTIYVPSGTYKISSTLIIWDFTVIYGEPSSRPTIILASGSMTSGSNPFIVTTPSGAKPAYSTDWLTRAGGTDPVTGGRTNSTNNLFDCYIRDINFTVAANNPGCIYVMYWGTAQGTGFRNSILTATSQQTAALGVGLDIGPGGGGQTIDNIVTNGGHWACRMGNYYVLPFRNCTFNGYVDNVNSGNGIRVSNFIGCTFNNPGGIGLDNQPVRSSGVEDCTFTANTQYQGAGNYHVENVKFATANTNPAIPAGTCVQYTSGPVYYNGATVAGNDPRLSTPGVVRRAPIPNAAYPYPGASCVNVESLGITPNGGNDVGPAINIALATHNELFFPIGDYTINTTINLGPGQHLFGGGCAYYSGSPSASFGPGFGQTYLSGSANPIIATSGNGTGKGIIITSMNITSQGNAPACIWNADPSSLVFDSNISPEGGNNLDDCIGIDIRSGGGLFTDGQWFNNYGPGPAGHGANSGIFVESSGPVYIIGISPQEYVQTAIILNGASNVYFNGVDGENGTLEMQITNCFNIHVVGLIADNYSANYLYATTVANSQVSLWGMTNESPPTGFQNQVGEEGVGYGGFGPLSGYVDDATNPTPTPTPTPKPTPTPVTVPTPTPIPTPTPTSVTPKYVQSNICHSSVQYSYGSGNIYGRTGSWGSEHCRCGMERYNG